MIHQSKGEILNEYYIWIKPWFSEKRICDFHEVRLDPTESSRGKGRNRHEFQDRVGRIVIKSAIHCHTCDPNSHQKDATCIPKIYSWMVMRLQTFCCFDSTRRLFVWPRGPWFISNHKCLPQRLGYTHNEPNGEVAGCPSCTKEFRYPKWRVAWTWNEAVLGAGVSLT